MVVLYLKVYHNTKVFSICFTMKGGENMYEKILELLEKNNETSYQVSKKIGISQTAFSNWKAGRSEPNVYNLKKLADYFGVSIEYFIN